jgi:acetate kinase
MDWIEQRSGRDALTAVGHRVVHGGPKYYKPQRITAEMVTELKQLSPFDPDHMPEEILLTEAFHRRFPDLPQVACFDTAFHHDLPRVAQMLPIPRRYEAQGVRRYGFHGLSYEFLMEELARLAGPDVARGRVILAHLGNGASLAAVHDGKSIDTSMSFTPTAGVPMSTRTGDLDPGLVWYLARTEKMSAKQFNDMVNFQSGLLGISETSSDMRDLLKHETQDVRAAEAVALFCYQVKKWIGSFAAALGGIETLVFAGGIGENAPRSPRSDLRRVRLSWNRTRRKAKRGERGRDFRGVQPSCGPRHSYGRRANNSQDGLPGPRPDYKAISITNYGCNCRSRIIEFFHEAGPDHILVRTHERRSTEPSSKRRAQCHARCVRPSNSKRIGQVLGACPLVARSVDCASGRAS